MNHNFDFRNTDQEPVNWKEVVSSASGLVVAIAAAVLLTIVLYYLTNRHQPLP